MSACAPRRLKVIYFRAAYNLPITLGLEHGVFARHGLNLEITYTLGSRMSGASLLSGAQDLGALALDDVVYEVEKRNADLFAFMGYNSGTIQLMARPGIQWARDLAGRTLGVDDPDSGFAFVAHGVLRGWGSGAMNTSRAERRPPPSRNSPEGGQDRRGGDRPALQRRTDDPGLHHPRAHPGSLAEVPGLHRRHDAALGRHEQRHARHLHLRLPGKPAVDPRPGQPRRSHRAPRKRFRPASGIAARTYDALADRREGLYRDADIDVPGIQTVLDLRVENGLLTAPTPSPAKYYDTSYLRRS